MEKDVLAWNLFVELRKEVVESQRIRSQVIGFKITFVTAAIGVAAANLEKLPPIIFVIPAVAAAFFDLLIASYGFSIKRAGSYIREHLEPILREASAWPSGLKLWEDYMAGDAEKQTLALWGNIGITALACVAGLGGLLLGPSRTPSVTWCTVIVFVTLALLAADIWAALLPSRFAAKPAKQAGR